MLKHLAQFVIFTDVDGVAIISLGDVAERANHLANRAHDRADQPYRGAEGEQHDQCHADQRCPADLREERLRVAEVGLGMFRLELEEGIGFF